MTTSPHQVIPPPPRQPVLAFSPHPLVLARDREVVHAVFLPGETIAAYLERTGIAAKMGRQPFVLTINGRRVPREMWWHVRPRQGTLINLYAVVHGGGGSGGQKKNPIATVLMIVVAIVATVITQGGASAYLGPAFGAGTTGAAALGAAVGVIGGLAVNAIFPPPKPQLPSAQSASPSYAISGGYNRARRYEPRPKYIGTHRVFPDLGAQTYTEFRGDEQFFCQVFDFGYNDLELSDFRIGATPLSEFTGVTLQESGPDGRLTLFPANVDVVAGAELRHEDGWIQRTSSVDTTALAIELTGQLHSQHPNGDLAPRAVIIGMEYRAVGAADWIPLEFEDDVPRGQVYTIDVDGISSLVKTGEWNVINQPESPEPGEITIIGRTRKLLRRTFKWNVAKGQYEVRVRRVTAQESAPVVSDIVWSQLRSYQPDEADYTGLKRVALEIRASGQLSGQVEQFNCIARARCQAWTGAAFNQTHTENPAWWYLDALRGKTVNGRRVYGAALPDARIDIEGLKAFANWCDAEGLTINCVLDQQRSVFDVLQAIALMGWATPSMGTGKHGVVWDAPNQEPTAVFGMHNIIPGSFEISYATEDLAEVIEGWFINPARDWQRDFVRVTVPGATGQSKVRRVELFGRTDVALAAKDTNRYAAQNAYRTKTYRWRSDWEAQPTARGDVALLAHDLASLDYSGRFIEGGNANLLKLPRSVPRYESGAFVVIVKPDGTWGSYAVQGGVGETDSLVPVAQLPFDPWNDPDGHPPYDYRWHYGPTSTPGRKVKVAAFQPRSERHVELLAIDERPEFYAAKDNPYIYTPPKPLFGLAPILSELVLIPEGVRTGNGYMVRVTAQWKADGDYGFADVRISVNDAAPELIAEGTRNNFASFVVTDLSEVTVEVIAYSSMGRTGRSARITTGGKVTVNFAALADPSDVLEFTISEGAFKWKEVPDLDVRGYRIRFHYGDRRSWDDAAPLHDGLITETPWRPTVMPEKRCVFLICAEDAAGRLSKNPGVIVKDLGDAPTANVVETIDYRALGWPGTITGGSIQGGDIVADDETAFYGPDDAAPIYTNDAAPFYPPSAFAAMAYETGFFAPTDPLVGSMMVIHHELAGEPRFIEYRQDGAEEFYGANDAEPIYGPDDNAPIFDAIGEYRPWPGAIEVLKAPYQFRVRTGQGDVQGVVAGLALEIDAPDLTELVDDLVISAAGTRVPITKPYTRILNVQGTLQADGGTAAKLEIVDKDPVLGPLIQAKDAAGAPVQGLGDIFIQGY